MKRLIKHLCAALFVVAILAPWVTPSFAEDYGAPIASGTALLTHADVALTAAASAAQVCPANTTKRISVILANTGATNSARIGDSNAAAAQGTPLAAGAQVTINTTSAVYGYSASGTTVGCTELLR